MNVTPRDGEVLVKCHADCDQGLLIAALRERELWPTDEQHPNVTPFKRIVATYDYRNADSQLLFQVVRYEPKDFRQRRPDGKGGWTWKLDGVERVLYRLPELRAANPAETVFIVEGEKDADRMAAHDLIATTNPHGAGKWRDTYNQELVGRDVVILPDQDDPGRAHAEHVAQSVAGVAASVRIVQLPAKDVSEWFGGGRTLDQLLQLTALVAPNPTSNPKGTSLEVGFPSPKRRSFYLADLLTDDGDDELVYLPLLGRPGYFVEGWSHLLAGYPRSGKTELVVASLEDWLKTGKSVLLFSEEPENLWRHRVRQRGAYPHPLRIFLGLGVPPAEMLDELRCSPEPIVMIDAIRNLLQFEDENDNSEIARKIVPWVAAAREYEKTLILVHHMRKGSGDNGEGIAGGHALLAAVDIALELVRDRNQAANRRKIRAYARLIQPPELLYELADGKLSALGDPSLVALAEVEHRVMEELSISSDWFKTSEVWQSLTEPRPSNEQVRKALLGLAKQGVVERDPSISVEKTSGKTVRWRLPATQPPTHPLLGGK